MNLLASKLGPILNAITNARVTNPASVMVVPASFAVYRAVFDIVNIFPVGGTHAGGAWKIH